MRYRLSVREEWKKIEWKLVEKNNEGTVEIRRRQVGVEKERKRNNPPIKYVTKILLIYDFGLSWKDVKNMKNGEMEF